MHRWFDVQTSPSRDGSFVIVHVESRDGRAADEIPEFIEQLVHHVIGYVLRTNVDLDHQFNDRYRLFGADAEGLVRNSVDRLLARHDDTDPYRGLKGFVGECLAHWLYKSFVIPIGITEPKAHSLDPAYDLVALVERTSDIQTLCIQAKTTAGYASDRCREAVAKYTNLHAGMYDFELANELYLLASIPAARDYLAGRNWRAVLLDPERREYAIFVAFDGTPPDGPRVQWPQSWSEAIPGPAERRVVITLPLADCTSFINRIARAIDAATP